MKPAGSWLQPSTHLRDAGALLRGSYLCERVGEILSVNGVTVDHIREFHWPFKVVRPKETGLHKKGKAYCSVCVCVCVCVCV
jgi:hypothetical protein